MEPNQQSPTQQHLKGSAVSGLEQGIICQFTAGSELFYLNLWLIGVDIYDIKY